VKPYDILWEEDCILKGIPWNVISIDESLVNLAWECLDNIQELEDWLEESTE